MEIKSNIKIKITRKNNFTKILNQIDIIISLILMRDIDSLIQENRTNYYKLLTILGNNGTKIDKIVKYLQKKDWEIYDVEKEVLELTNNIPVEKIKLRIGTEIKKWVKQLGNRLVLFNSNILYSKEMDKIGPFRAFKYCMRGKKEAVLFMDAKLKGVYAIYSTPDRPDYLKVELSDVLFEEIKNIKLPEV